MRRWLLQLPALRAADQTCLIVAAGAAAVGNTESDDGLQPDRMIFANDSRTQGFRV